MSKRGAFMSRDPIRNLSLPDYFIGLEVRRQILILPQVGVRGKTGKTRGSSPTERKACLFRMS